MANESVIATAQERVQNVYYWYCEVDKFEHKILCKLSYDEIKELEKFISDSLNNGDLKLNSLKNN